MATNDILQLAIAIRDLRNREEAQALAAQQAQAAQQLAALQEFRQMAASSANPYGFTPMVDEWTGRTGMSEEALRNILALTPPSTQAMQGVTVQQGLTQAGPMGGGLPEQAASTVLTGRDIGQNAMSAVLSDLYGGGDALERFDQVLQRGWQQGALERLATGRTPEQARREEVFLGLPEEEQVAQARIAGGTQLSAGQLGSLEQGWAQLRHQDRALAQSAAEAEARLTLMRQELEASLQKNNGAIPTTEGMKMISDMLEGRRQLADTMLEAGTKVTGEGQVVFMQQYNNYNALLRQLGFPLPPEADFDLSKNYTVDGLASHIMAYVREK